MFVELQCCEKCFMHKQYSHQEWVFHQNFCKLDQTIQRKCKLKVLKNAILPLPVLHELQKYNFADNQFVEKLVEQQKLKFKPRIETFQIKYRGLNVFSLLESKNFPDFNLIAKILLIIKKTDMNGLNLIEIELRNNGTSTIYELSKIKNQTSIEKAIKLQFLQELAQDTNQKKFKFFASQQKKFPPKESSLKNLKRDNSQQKINIPKQNLFVLQKKIENEFLLKPEGVQKSPRNSQRSMNSKYANSTVSIQQISKEGQLKKKHQKQIRFKKYQNRFSSVNKKSSLVKKLSKSDYDKVRQQKYEFLSKQSDLKCDFLQNICFQLANLSDSSDSDDEAFKNMQNRDRFNSFELTDDFIGTQLLEETPQIEKTLDEKIQNDWSNQKQNFSKTSGTAFFPHNNDLIKISRVESVKISPSLSKKQVKKDEEESLQQISNYVELVSQKQIQKQEMTQNLSIKQKSSTSMNQDIEDNESFQQVQNHENQNEILMKSSNVNQQQIQDQQIQTKSDKKSHINNEIKVTEKTEENLVDEPQNLQSDVKKDQMTQKLQKESQQKNNQKELSAQNHFQTNNLEEAQALVCQKNSPEIFESSTNEMNILKSSQQAEEKTNLNEPVEEKNEKDLIMEQQPQNSADKRQTAKVQVQVQVTVNDKIPQTQKSLLDYFSSCLQTFSLIKSEFNDSNFINQSQIDQIISVEQFFSKVYPCPRIILETKSKKKVIKMIEVLIQPYLKEKQSEKEWLEINELSICKIFFIHENQSPQITHTILFNRSNPEKTKFFITDQNQEIQSFIELEELEKQFKQVLFLFYDPSYQLKSCFLSHQNDSQVEKENNSALSKKFNVEIKVAPNISQSNDQNADESNHIFISFEMKNINPNKIQQQKNGENKGKTTEPKIKIQVFKSQQNEANTQENSSNLIGEIQKKGSFFFELNLDAGRYYCVVEIFSNKAEKNLNKKQIQLLFYSLVDIEIGKVEAIEKE